MVAAAASSPVTASTARALGHPPTYEARCSPVSVERAAKEARVNPRDSSLANCSRSRLRVGRHGGMSKIEEAPSDISCFPV